jgi:hypothetical protein
MYIDSKLQSKVVQHDIGFSVQEKNGDKQTRDNSTTEQVTN